MILPWFRYFCQKQRTSILRSVACAFLAAATGPVVCAAALPTTTTITVTSGAGPVTTVAAGSVVTLTATVNAGSTAVTVGQVNFCDAWAISCTDIHLLGTAQLTSAGTALFRFRPGIANHSYKAVFVGTNTYAGSSSSTSALSVTGTVGVLATSTTIAETGSWGNYALTATVTESGGTAPPSGTVSLLDTSAGNAVLATPTLGPAVAGVNWPNPQQLTTSNIAQAAALGDFNGDGIPDLAASVAQPDGHELMIFLGNANGSYTIAPELSFSAYTFGPIVVADFNGDGKQDLAVSSSESNTVTILLGNGDGTFQLVAASPSIPANSTQAAVGDFNGDGVPDLVVICSSSSVNILLGNGDGTFTATPNSPVVSGSPYAIAVGDFNRDGKLDFAVSDLYSDSIFILGGNGDGTFRGATTVHSGGTSRSVVTADFNGDGKLDLALGVSGAGGVNDSVTILEGNGDGSFIAPAASQTGGSNSISSLNLGDFNGDGVPDLALTDSVSGVLTTFLSNGNGSFTAFSTVLPWNPYHQFFCAVGDVNGDGRSDLAIGDQDGYPLAIYLTEPTETATATANLNMTGVGQHLVDASYGGDGSYTSSLSSTLPLWGVQPATATSLTVKSGGISVTAVAPGSVVALTATVAVGATPVTAGQVNFCDASAQQCADIHLLGTAALLNNGTATFQFVPGAGTHSYKAVFIEDGFGLSSASATSTLSVGPAKKPSYTDTTAISSAGSAGNYSLTGTVVGYGGTAAPTGNISFLDTSFGNASLATVPLGQGTAGVGWLVSQIPAMANRSSSQVTGDFNGDGIPDLAVLSATSDGPASIAIFFGKGDGTFTAGPTTNSTVTSVINYPMVAGDFNGDGKTDLAILSNSLYPGEYLTAFLGKGDGTFAVPTSLTIPQYTNGGDGLPGSLIAADWNGDGKIDLALAGDYISQGGVTIALGNGDGTFALKGASLQATLNYSQVATGDFNGDAIPDLVATPGSGGASVFLGKGDGTFAMAAPLALGAAPSSIVVGDFNQDGRPDLAFGSPLAVDIFFGNGDGTFTQAAGTHFAVAGSMLTAGDFNRDGKLDLAAVDGYFGLVDILIGSGDGTFAQVSTSPPVSQEAAAASSIVAADFNGDGVPDLSMLGFYQVTSSILLSVPTQTASATVNGVNPTGAGTHNVVASYSGDGNYASTSSASVALGAAVAPVTLSPSAGKYTTAQTITLSDKTPGTAIYYWLVGPVSTQGFVLYTAPIPLNQGGVESILTYASETGYQQSPTTTTIYDLNLPTLPAPVLSPAAGSYSGPQTVTIADAVAGATIYYTTNGSTPTASSAKYTGAIKVSSSETVAAIAIGNGHTISSAASAQYLIGSSRSSFIYTIAGNGRSGYSGDGGPAFAAQVNYPSVSILDSAGNLYFADSGNNVVRKVAATGVITTIAGNTVRGYSGDNGPATAAELAYPVGLALDAAGNLFIGDAGNSVVRKVAATTGVITTIAGNGTTGYTGDGGPATSAQMYFPAGIAIDTAGNLYIADCQIDVVREVAANTGIITTKAGSTRGYAGDGGPATAAELDYPYAVAVDATDNLYIADSFNNVVRKVDARTGSISTVAGNGYGAGSNLVSGPNKGGYTGDGGPATSAELFQPEGVAIDGAGNLYIADTQNQVVRMVTATNGNISTVAGDGSACGALAGDGGPATNAALCYPQGIMADGAGNLFIGDSNQRMREVRVSSLPPTTQTAAPTFSIAPGTYAGPQTVTVADSTPGAALYITLNGALPRTSGTGYLGPISVSGNAVIKAIAVAPGYAPSTYVTGDYTITAKPTAVIATVAGDGVQGFYAGGGSPENAQFGSPAGVTVDRSGNVFFADSTNNVVWELNAKSGQISIVAGIGPGGASGNSGLATNTLLFAPSGVAVDSMGNLYIADTNAGVVRKVAVGTGLSTIYAGGGTGSSVDVGDGGPATSAWLSFPRGLAMDGAGNLYIADSNNSRVRMVSAATGLISTVAGNGDVGNSGDGGPATGASVGEPGALALDTSGNLYIAALNSGLVRKVTTSTGIITRVAGNGDPGTSGDGGPAVKAEIYPQGLAVDSAGNLYIADRADVREVAAGTGLISRVAGSGYVGYSGDGGAATVSRMAYPQGISFDALGDLYVADQNNRRIREVFSSGHAFVTPEVTITLPQASFTTAESVTVVVSVSGGAGHPVANAGGGNAGECSHGNCDFLGRKHLLRHSDLELHVDWFSGGRAGFTYVQPEPNQRRDCCWGQRHHDGDCSHDRGLEWQRAQSLGRWQSFGAGALGCRAVYASA